MFNKKSAATEIADAMESNLVSEAVDQQNASLTKLAKAIDYLNVVADIFDEVGLKVEAEVATALLESFAKKKPAKKTKKKPSKSSPTKGLNSEKMVKNLKEKGWVFNADDEDKGSCMYCGDHLMVDDEPEEESPDTYRDLSDTIRAPSRHSTNPPDTFRNPSNYPREDFDPETLRMLKMLKEYDDAPDFEDELPEYERPSYRR